MEEKENEIDHSSNILKILMKEDLKDEINFDNIDNTNFFNNKEESGKQTDNNTNNNRKKTKFNHEEELKFDFQELSDEPITKKELIEEKIEENLLLEEENESETVIQTLIEKEAKKSLWMRMREKVVGSVLGEDTMEALKQIFQIYQTFTKELQGYNLLTILMACKIISVHDESNKRITTGEIFDDLDEMREINHWWKYTSSSFGWQFNLGKEKSKQNQIKTNQKKNS